MNSSLMYRCMFLSFHIIGFSSYIFAIDTSIIPCDLENNILWLLDPVLFRYEFKLYLHDKSFMSLLLFLSLFFLLPLLYVCVRSGLVAEVGTSLL